MIYARDPSDTCVNQLRVVEKDFFAKFTKDVLMYCKSKMLVLLSPMILFQAALQAAPDWDVASGNWNTNTNWNPQTVPAAGDNPVIANGGIALLNAAGVGTDLTIGGISDSGLNVLTNGQLNLSGNFLVGGAAGQVGHATFSGNPVVMNSGSLNIALAAGSSASVSFSNGAIANTNAVQVGSNTLADGQLRVLTANTTFNASAVTAGDNGGRGEIDVLTGGAMTVAAQINVGVGDGSIGVFNADGPGAAVTCDTLGLGLNVIATPSTGTLNISNGAELTSTNGTSMTDQPSGIAILNLNGVSGSRGRLITPKLIRGSGTTTINFDGGAIEATATDTDFITGISTINVLPEGAFIDSSTFSVGTANPFAGLGPVTKLGLGTLTFNGELNNFGGLFVDEGQVITNGSVDGPVIVNNAASLVANNTLNGFLTLNDSADATTNGIVEGAVNVNEGSVLVAAAPLNSTLTTNGNVFVQVNSTVAGPVELNGGETTLTGTFFNTATVNTGGLLVGPTGVINGAAVLNNNGTMALQGTLNNSLTLNDAAQAGVFAGAQINGLVNVNDNSSFLVDVGGVVTGVVTTQGNGTLIGGGSIGALDNAGIVSPGENSIATLTILGNYINRATGRYRVELNTIGQSDLLLSIGGVATLEGGTLELDAVPGNYLAGTSYTLIQAAGGLSGQYASVIADLPINYTLLYFPNSLMLRLGDAISFSGLTGNPRRVAQYINTFGTISGDFLNVLTALQSLDSDDLYNALDQLHPAPFQALSITSGDAAHMVNDSFMDRLNFLRTTQCGPCQPCGQGGVWISGLVNYVNFNRTQGLRGFDATHGGLALGYDQCFCDDMIAGIGAGYSNNYIKWNRQYGHSDGNNYYLGLYATKFDQDYYADFSLLGFTGRYKSKRHIEFADIDRHAKSKQCNWGINPHFGSGFILDYCGFDVIPFGEIDYYYVSQDKFHEHGADSLNLHLRSNDASLLRLETGVRFAKTYDCCDYGQFLPYASISYVGHRYYGRKFKSSFNDQAESFSVFGTDRCFNQAEFGLGFAYLINDQFAINTSYDIDVGSKRRQQEFNFELSYRF